MKIKNKRLLKKTFIAISSLFALTTISLLNMSNSYADENIKSNNESSFKYVLVLGSFKDEANAEAYLNKIKDYEELSGREIICVDTSGDQKYKKRVMTRAMSFEDVNQLKTDVVKKGVIRGVWVFKLPATTFRKNSEIPIVEKAVVAQKEKEEKTSVTTNENIAPQQPVQNEMFFLGKSVKKEKKTQFDGASIEIIKDDDFYKPPTLTVSSNGDAYYTANDVSLAEFFKAMNANECVISRRLNKNERPNTDGTHYKWQSDNGKQCLLMLFSENEEGAVND